jgi:ribose transport system substrate-binding protein
MRSFTAPVRRLAIGLGAALSGVALAAGGAAPADAAAPAKHLSIAYFTDALDNVYLTTATSAAEKMAAKYHASIHVFSSNWDSNTQLTQIQDAVSSGKYQALVVEADDGQAVCTPLMNAAKKGMIVSVYNAPICGNGRKLYTTGTVGFFGGDDYEYGQLLGKEMIKALHGKGTVAYVSGPTDNSIVQVTTEGLVSELKTAPGIQLVAQLDGEWDAAQGLTETEDLVQAHPSIDGIVYGVDQMAIPSVDYLAKQGLLKHIKIVSLGATTNAAKDIRAGEMYAGVVQLPAQEAEYAIEAAVQTFEKKPVSVPGWNAKTHVYNLLNDPSLHGATSITAANLGAFRPEWSV